MNLKDILLKLESGNMNIVLNSHVISEYYLKYQIKEYKYIDRLSMNKEFVKDLYNKLIEEGLNFKYKNGRQITQEEYDADIKQCEFILNDGDITFGDNIFYPYEKYIECYDCNEDLRVILRDENTLEVISENECEYKKQRDEGKIVTEINVPSGKLLFCNYFDKKEIYRMPLIEGKINNINFTGGVIELAEYLAEKNIGYGQMGNMSVGVYVNEDGSEIIIGEPSDYDYEEDEVDETPFKDYKYIGDISLNVWRWMCGDLTVLDEHGEKYPENLVPNQHLSDKYLDYILLDVKPGKWVIEHYYMHDFKNNKTYSKLRLK